MNSAKDRPRAKTLNPLRALLPFLRPYRGMMIAALFALLVAAAAMLALPLALRQLIDHGLAARDSRTINLYFIGFLAAATVFVTGWQGSGMAADAVGKAFAVTPAAAAGDRPLGVQDPVERDLRLERRRRREREHKHEKSWFHRATAPATR